MFRVQVVHGVVSSSRRREPRRAAAVPAIPGRAPPPVLFAGASPTSSSTSTAQQQARPCSTPTGIGHLRAARAAAPPPTSSSFLRPFLAGFEALVSTPIPSYTSPNSRPFPRRNRAPHELPRWQQWLFGADPIPPLLPCLESPKRNPLTLLSLPMPLASRMEAGSAIPRELSEHELTVMATRDLVQQLE